jgi:hypothetical protein
LPACRQVKLLYTTLSTFVIFFHSSLHGSIAERLAKWQTSQLASTLSPANILIFSKTKEVHQQHVVQVLKKLQAHKLFALPEKCTFYSSRFSFLGFTISPDGIKMKDSKLSTILDWPYLNNVKELSRFLGYLNFYRKFI